jgi:hypothetical protein
MVEFFLICLGILCIITIPILAFADGWRGAVIGFVLALILTSVVSLRYGCSEIEYNNGVCLECGGHYEFCNGSRGLLYYECDDCGNVISKLDD